ncbi:host cell division inhibitory peptide Kil [Enterobacter kobei]|uniref:host cell division inhibitory peptide Kil n=2 Tax=Enterobacter kobei TaxID=208224 RepID=UPI0028D838F5|nr:host cell division inhibitory peptide Kil [Enterobacter kobei]WNP36211.1 host cell division inhibitory peptide Kil [Enterobacter kobei]
MLIAGFGHIVEQSIVDTKILRAALSKKAIARYLDDLDMLEQANEAQRKALGMRVYRNSFEVRV